MSAAAIVRTSTCPLDCPDLCALEVAVEGDRVVKIDGLGTHPVTDGFICGKVRRFADHVYGPDRLLTPARRVGRKGEGRFEPISWNEALDQIVAEFRKAIERFGGESILPFCYGGSNGKYTHDAIDSRLFRRIGASRLARTVCAAPTGRVATEMYGKMHGVAFEDYAEAKLIIIWGANPQASGIHLVPFIREARRRGARLVVIDPRTTALARQADLHLAVEPGTDVVVALSIIRWLFEAERADLDFLRQHALGVDGLRQRSEPWTFARAAAVARVDEAAIATLAQWYSDTNPAVIRCGWGIERSKSAGSNVAAVLALPAVAGKFGVRGGGYTMSNSGAWQFAANAAIGDPPAMTREINMNHLGRALVDERSPPVQVLFVYNANPLATIPHQRKVQTGLEREDLFTVVFEQVMTDTARFADILLPATTFLEHHDFRVGYGVAELRAIEPVIRPVGQSRSNPEVFAELCQRMGVARDGDAITPDQWIETYLGTSDQAIAARNQLGATGTAVLPSGTRPIQFVDVFPATNHGKIELLPARLDAEAPSGLYAYVGVEPQERFPLRMISPATELLVNSTFGQLVRQIVPLEIHPDDAAARNIRDGDQVRVFNDQAEVVCPARISSEVRPGVVVLPKGLWRHHTLNGWSSNALAPDDLTDVAGGACFNDTLVQIVVDRSAIQRP